MKIPAEFFLVFLVIFLLFLSLSLPETGEIVAPSHSPQTDSGHRLSVWVATEQRVGEVGGTQRSTPLTIEGVGESNPTTIGGVVDSNSTTPAKLPIPMAACSKPVC